MRAVLGEITLSNGATLVVKEPLVGDLKESSSELAQNLNLVAACCELSVDEVRKIGLKDYKRLQNMLDDYLLKE